MSNGPNANRWTPPPPRIVVGVDGSQESEQALRWALDLQDLAGPGKRALIVAVIAWDFEDAYLARTVVPGEDVLEVARRVLERSVKEALPDQVPGNVELLVREGGAARQLIDLSEGALMVVLGSRGQGGFAGLLIGSVSAKVAEHAHCPVLVVHGERDSPGRWVGAGTGAGDRP